MEGRRRKPKKRYCPQISLGGTRHKKKERVKLRERLALRNKVKEEEQLEIYGGVKRRDRNENVCTAQ